MDRMMISTKSDIRIENPGDMVEQWLTPLTHIKKFLGSPPGLGALYMDDCQSVVQMFTRSQPKHTGGTLTTTQPVWFQFNVY